MRDYEFIRDQFLQKHSVVRLRCLKIWKIQLENIISARKYRDTNNKIMEKHLDNKNINLLNSIIETIKD